MPEVVHVTTGAGRLAVRLSTGVRTPLLLIHGNSMSARAFDGLLNGPLGRSYRLMAVDLPGHGASDDAAFPDIAYTLPGYADAMLDALFALDCPGAIVCGWSLGGHIAFEMMSRSPLIPAALAIATPPVRPGPSAAAGFDVTGTFGLFMTEHLDDAGKRVLADVSAGAAAAEFAYEAVARADGRARRIFAESMLNGIGADPAPLFRDPLRPVALVTGAREEFVSRDFMQSIQGPALWRGGVQQITGAAHAPFLEAPAEFAAMLLQFVRDVASLRRARPQADGAPGASRRLTA